MMNIGTIVNFDHSPMTPVGTLYIRKEEGTYDVVPCETNIVLDIFKKMYGSSENKVLLGKNVAYWMLDGVLERIGPAH